MKRRNRQPDFVSILEALYAVEQPVETWLGDLLATVNAALETPAGVGAVLYRLGSSTPLTLERIDAIGVPDGWLEVGIQHHNDPELQAYIRRGYETVLCADLNTIDVGVPPPDALAAAYKGPSVRRVLLLNGCDTSGRGIALYLFSDKEFRFSQRHSELLARVATHLSTAHRLQRRVAGDASAPVEAVLTPKGRIEHAEPIARSREAQSSLTDSVQRISWARGPGRNDPPQSVLMNWRGLVTGRWTLVDRYERGGKRYVVACENTPRVPTGHPLSERELQVVTLAAHGRPNKLIAYELGLAHSTIRVLLARAAQKLGARSRAELLERFRALRNERTS